MLFPSKEKEERGAKLECGNCQANTGSLIHKGPYETLNQSYEKIMETTSKKKGYQAKLPTREVYIKGPGMIFEGKLENYLTEIQILVKK